MSQRIIIQRWQRTRGAARLVGAWSVTGDTRKAARLFSDALDAMQSSRHAGYVAVYRDGVRDYQPIVLSGRLL